MKTKASSQLAPPATHSKKLASPSKERDDLVDIEGIDPATEMALNSIGIRQFSDFRGHTPETLAQALQARAGLFITPETIAKQDWLGWAEILAAENASSVTSVTNEEKPAEKVTRSIHSQEETSHKAKLKKQHSRFTKDAGDESKSESLPEKTSPQEKKHSSRQTKQDGIALSIQDVKFVRVETPAIASQPSTKQLRSKIHCSLSGVQAAAEAAGQITLYVQIHATDTITGAHLPLACHGQRLQANPTDYHVELEFKVPGPGNYQLFVIAFLLQTNSPVSFYQGPTLRVIP